MSVSIWFTQKKKFAYLPIKTCDKSGFIWLSYYYDVRTNVHSLWLAEKLKPTSTVWQRVSGNFKSTKCIISIKRRGVFDKIEFVSSKLEEALYNLRLEQ